MTRPQFIAARNDGFGTRMLGFLNAIYLAEVYKRDFGFVWPLLDEGTGFHGIPGPDGVFAADYLRRYLVTGVDADALPRIDRDYPAPDAVASLLDQHAAIAVTAHIHAGKPAWPGAPAPDCPRLWGSIGWSPRIQSLLDRARSSVPANAIGFHIRRGDIVYGPSRALLYQQKYVPLGWCRKAIATELAAGRPVVAFCDDPMVIDSFRRHFPALNFAESESDYTRFERDVFELAALSCCARIVGRSSGFSILASLISGCERENFTMPRGQGVAAVIEDIAECPADYPPLGEARDLSWIAVEAVDVLSPAKRDALLARASELDPWNASYPYLRAAALARERKLDEAESVVAGIAETEHSFQEPRELTGISGRGIFEFRRPSPERHPYLAAFHLSANRGQYSPEERRAALATCHAAKPESAALLAAYVDELTEQGAFREAAECLTAAFNRGHSALRSHAKMSWVALQAGDLESSVRHGRIVLDLRPHDVSTSINVVEALVGLRRADEARSLAVSIDPAKVLRSDEIGRLREVLSTLNESARAEQVARNWADRPLSATDPRATRAAHPDKRRSFASKVFRTIRKRLKLLLAR